MGGRGQVVTGACPFCELPSGRLVGEERLVVTIRDLYPVSPGHTLVIPRRHFSSFFEATAEEVTAIQDALHCARAVIDEELRPDGYNIGVNVGEAAGQTVMHLHVHLIPRFQGDMDDPRGGIRHCVQSKGYYDPK